MQINIDDRGAAILALISIVAGALAFAPDMVADVLNTLGAMLQGVSP